jgi:asparagine synthase (glutamine-hydrolysing)
MSASFQTGAQTSDRDRPPEARVLICAGSPRFNEPLLAGIAAKNGPAAAWMEAFAKFGIAAASDVAGDFCIALTDIQGRTFLAVDRFGIQSICYRLHAGRLQVAQRAVDLAGTDAAIDPQAIFDYLYFHVIPGPRTAFRDVQRLPAGHYALFDGGRLTVAPWWTPVFVEHSVRPLGELTSEFGQILRESVEAQVDGKRVGCFLSGGTDSSTLTGMLQQAQQSPPLTFSIGFDAEGYDEMEYARITARHFKTDHHEYYVTPEDVVRCVPDIAKFYDQPFGNSSVAPAYYCAKLAAHNGVERMLAGDGGDELFGGNTRYAKQRIFALYERLPGSVRARLLEPALSHTSLLARIPGIKKAVSYVEQARVPMPDRLQAYNLLTWLGPAEVLTPEFLSLVDLEEPLRQQRAIYRACTARSLVNRMLAYDWKYTLADNDLPKVTGAVGLAGISVGFPLLDNRIVDFSLRLQPHLKVKGLTLRWFFKHALRGFLPPQTISKKKHGFGLPVGAWMMTHSGLRTLALESLDMLRSGGIVRPAFLDRLAKEYLPQHPRYYGEMIWILMMLAQWQAAQKRLVVR